MHRHQWMLRAPRAHLFLVKTLAEEEKQEPIIIRLHFPYSHSSWSKFEKRLITCIGWNSMPSFMLDSFQTAKHTHYNPLQVRRRHNFINIAPLTRGLYTHIHTFWLVPFLYSAWKGIYCAQHDALSRNISIYVWVVAGMG